jgi:nitric oxide synthase oxygenase domain/subunit
MKNNGDPRAMIGQRRLKQIQKQAAGIRGAPGGDKDDGNTILLLEEAREWLAQFYSETVGKSTDFKQFLIHEKREKEAGRCVYADWSWIVPYFRGYYTRLSFHRTFKERNLKPNFLAQPERWEEARAGKCPFG